MSFRQMIRRMTPKIALGAAVMTALSACRDADVELDADMRMEVIDDDHSHGDPATTQVLQAVSSWSRPFRFGGRKYTVTLFRREGRFFLCSCINSDYELGACALKELGENIVIFKPGLFFEDDRMAVEYRDSAGKRRKVCVPFGDVYGSTHDSEMPPFIPDRYAGSEKYGVSGARKKDDAVIESCLPTLQELLRRDDAETLADMMIYPLPADVGFSLTFIKNREEFIELYPRIFTPTRKREILKLPSTDIFCNYKGLMLDRGLWFHIADDGKPYFRCLFFVIE